MEKSEGREIKTALCCAIENEKLEILKLLLTNEKVDVNITCEYTERYKLCTYRRSRKYYCEEKTSLYLDVEYKNVEIINALLSNKKIVVNKSYTKNIENTIYNKNEDRKFMKDV